LKNIREFSCSDIAWRVSFFSRPGLPKAVVETLGNGLKNSYKDPAYKKWQPLLKTFNIRFFDSEPDEYKSMFALYETATKNGWFKDYKQFEQYVNKR